MNRIADNTVPMAIAFRYAAEPAVRRLRTRVLRSSALCRCPDALSGGGGELAC